MCLVVLLQSLKLAHVSLLTKVFKIQLENRNQNAFSIIAKKSITPQLLKLDLRKLICKYFHTC